MSRGPSSSRCSLVKPAQDRRGRSDTRCLAKAGAGAGASELQVKRSQHSELLAEHAQISSSQPDQLSASCPARPCRTRPRCPTRLCARLSYQAMCQAMCQAILPGYVPGCPPPPSKKKTEKSSPPPREMGVMMPLTTMSRSAPGRLTLWANEPKAWTARRVAVGKAAGQSGSAEERRAGG